MIKKYKDFIKENLSKTFGEWVEDHLNDEYIKNIVARYTNDISQDIDISNALNILDTKIQSDIKHQIEDYLANGIDEKEPEIIASTDVEELLESDITVAGKGIFTSFLKSLTALGQKNSEPNWDLCPDNFLLYYDFSNLDTQTVIMIFNRFKSLNRYTELFDSGNNTTSLYFGIRCDAYLEYGIINNNTKNIVGQFKMSISVIKWIVGLTSQSATSIKKEIVNMTYNDLITIGKVKIDMAEFNPGYHEKRLSPILKDKIISFGYYGIGKWDNGKLDDGEFINIKTNFTNWISTKKWVDRVLISLKPNSFWLNIHIKLK
jgi:hypothetical protein